MNIDIEELKLHRDQINALAARVPFSPPDEEGCEITYLRVPQVSLEDGKQEGIQEFYERQRRKVKERPKLRKGTKYYVRLVRKDGKLLRVDKFHDGRIVVVHIAHYENGVRYLLPFSEDGGFYGTHTYVTHWENGRVSEEYACAGNQILRWSFDYRADGAIDVSMVNAVPGGNEPVICWKTATYTPGEVITCADTGYWDFWMKDQEESANE